MPKPFLFFDMGNVLLNFSHRKAAQQMAAALGADAEAIWDFVFAGENDLNRGCDSGELNQQQFYEIICERFSPKGAERPTPEALWFAASDIFEVNVPMKAILCRLKGAGHRVGLLSNTCDLHWEYIVRQGYGLFPNAFDAVALSYALKLQKPERKIYEAAAKLANVSPQDIIYTDDIQKHVDGARAAGWDAILYTTPAAYAAELHKRGIGFNW